MRCSHTVKFVCIHTLFLRQAVEFKVLISTRGAPPNPQTVQGSFGAFLYTSSNCNCLQSNDSAGLRLDVFDTYNAGTNYGTPATHHPLPLPASFEIVCQSEYLHALLAVSLSLFKVTPACQAVCKVLFILRNPEFDVTMLRAKVESLKQCWDIAQTLARKKLDKWQVWLTWRNYNAALEVVIIDC